MPGAGSGSIQSEPASVIRRRIIITKNSRYAVRIKGSNLFRYKWLELRKAYIIVKSLALNVDCCVKQQMCNIHSQLPNYTF